MFAVTAELVGGGGAGTTILDNVDSSLFAGKK
jgi:hypothetical protein